jgi:hypothetical protein
MALTKRIFGYTEGEDGAGETILRNFVEFSDDFFGDVLTFMHYMNGFNYNLNSSEEFAQELLDKISKVDFRNEVPSLIKAYHENPERTITIVAKKLRQGALGQMLRYVKEGEWLIPNKELVIPPNSQAVLDTWKHEARRACNPIQASGQVPYLSH